MTEDREPDFLWGGKPVYRCRLCPYERMENLAAVLEHEAGHQRTVRESKILGSDGEPLSVMEEEPKHEEPRILETAGGPPQLADEGSRQARRRGR